MHKATLWNILGPNVNLLDSNNPVQDCVPVHMYPGIFMYNVFLCNVFTYFLHSDQEIFKKYLEFL